MTQERPDIDNKISPQSAELFHLIVENVKDYAIFMTDVDGRVVSWNPGVERLLGYTESEILGASIAIIFTAADVAAGAHLKEMQTAACEGCSEDKRWHRRKDNTLFWANGMVMPLKDEDGKLRGFAKIMRNDTKQKLAEENLEQVLSSITDSFYRFDRDLRYTYVNQATTDMFGFSEAEFLGKTLWELFPNVPGNTFHDQVARALKNQEKIVFENYYAPLDRWFENRVYPSEGGLSVFTSEITERKRAEERLRQSEEKYRTLFDSIDSGFCKIEVIFDASGKAIDHRFLEINPAFEKQSGLKNAIGKTMREFAPNHEEFWSETYGKIALTGIAARFEYYAAALNRWFDVFAFRVGESESRTVAILFNDITERKEAEEKLRASEERFRAIVTQATIGIAETAEGRFTYVNDRFCELTGRSREQLIGMSVGDITHWEEREREMQILKRMYETGQPFVVDNRYIRPDNSIMWVLNSVTPIRDAEGRIIGGFAAAIDVTARKQAEEERERLLTSEQTARAQAEQANRLKDEFLATLSHELRTPLNAILGWAQMLRTSTLEASETQKALAVIERNARAQNQLIEDLLDVSRIITGKLRLNVQAVDLSTVISAAVDAARPAAEAKHIRLQTLLDPSAGPLSGDPDRLQQVVWNLLSNAVKFTPKGGRVQVRLERVNSHIEIVVSDTGKGIEAEFLPHVFDRFRQADGSTTRRHGGLGLGLAIVRQLVELHGGTVSVTSLGEGQGATFTVNLPLLPARREPASAVPRVHPMAQNNSAINCPPELIRLRVLLVDDEADSRELLNLVLEECGANVAAASSAAEAFEIFKGERFDVIVSDIGMPEEDGFSLIRRIRNLPNEQGGNVPALALTAYARAEDRVQALRSGFQMHIAKPVDPSELVVAVANLAGRMRNPIHNGKSIS